MYYFSRGERRDMDRSGSTRRLSHSGAYRRRPDLRLRYSHLSPLHPSPRPPSNGFELPPSISVVGSNLPRRISHGIEPRLFEMFTRDTLFPDKVLHTFSKF